MTGNAVGNTFTYADPATGTEKTATFKSTDVFTVDGLTATSGVFALALSVGDQVTILANTPSTGVTTYNLVNKFAADFTSGLVGNVNTASGTHTFDIIEPVTATPLRSAIDYSGSYTFYTVNGTSATQASFELNINEGDTVVITGKNTLVAPRTIALTDTTVTGTASGIVTTDDSATPPVVLMPTVGACLAGSRRRSSTAAM